MVRDSPDFVLFFCCGGEEFVGEVLMLDRCEGRQEMRCQLPSLIRLKIEGEGEAGSAG
jgi:hypothetical protein